MCIIIFGIKLNEYSDVNDIIAVVISGGFDQCVQTDGSFIFTNQVIIQAIINVY